MMHNGSATQQIPKMHFKIQMILERLQPMSFYFDP